MILKFMVSFCKLFYHNVICNIVQGGEKTFKPPKMKVYKPYMCNFAKADIDIHEMSRNIGQNVQTFSRLYTKWQNQMNKSSGDSKSQPDEIQKQV